ncbi:hypothetical protein RFI_18836, partial [Reticulomyxa filosa]
NEIQLKDKTSKPKIRKLGVHSDDGFEEYDVDFGEEEEEMRATEENSITKTGDKEKDNKQLRHQLLQEQLQVEDLKVKRRKSVFKAHVFQEELKKIKAMTAEQFEQYKLAQTSPQLQDHLFPPFACSDHCECHPLRHLIQSLLLQLDDAHQQSSLPFTREKRDILAQMAQQAFQQLSHSQPSSSLPLGHNINDNNFPFNSFTHSILVWSLKSANCCKPLVSRLTVSGLFFL